MSDGKRLTGKGEIWSGIADIGLYPKGKIRSLQVDVAAQTDGHARIGEVTILPFCQKVVDADLGCDLVGVVVGVRVEVGEQMQVACAGGTVIGVDAPGAAGNEGAVVQFGQM